MISAAGRATSNTNLCDSTHERQRIKVVIFGNQRLLADSIGALLANARGIDVIANTRWGPESPLLAATLNPDVVVIDFHLDGWTAGHAARAISRAGTRARVIFLAPRQADACMVAALEVGASAVVDPRRPAAELIATVRRVARRELGISSAEIAWFLEQRRAGIALRSRVTSREVEVLNRVANAQSTRDIAAALGISYVTVRTHLRNLASKLAVHNRIELVVKARRCGLLADSSAQASAIRRVSLGDEASLADKTLESSIA